MLNGRERTPTGFLKMPAILFKPNLLPMKAVRFEIIFSLEARTLGSENKRIIFSNMALLFLRAFRGKEFKSDPFIGSKLGFKPKVQASREKIISSLTAFIG